MKIEHYISVFLFVDSQSVTGREKNREDIFQGSILFIFFNKFDICTQRMYTSWTNM